MGGRDWSSIGLWRIGPGYVEVVAVPPDLAAAHSHRDGAGRGVVDARGDSGRFGVVARPVFRGDRQTLRAFGRALSIDLD